MTPADRQQGALVTAPGVLVVGGGPAGLVTALGLRRWGVFENVTVVERRGMGESAGWGISLDEGTTDALAAVDEVAAARIRQALHPWNTVSLRRDGATVTAAGSRLAAVSRDHVVAVLEQRCRQAGVQVLRGTLADPLDDLGDEVRLMVGADGVRSRVRSAAALAVEERQGANYFVWLAATSDRLDPSMLFRVTPTGPLLAYVYPYAPGKFTFIVECPEAVWHRSGFPDMSLAESVAFVGRSFADDLGDGVLHADGARWTRFTTVRTGRWHAGRTVLVGDAAHTAHFSVGLGTRMAVEDAVELWRALARPGGLDAALSAYEAARRPVVEAGQHRAAQSQSWFERFERYYRFPPVQFAFSWRTRQDATTFERLRSMDPRFTDAVCAVLSANADTGPAGDRTPGKREPLDVSADVDGTILPGRVLRAPSVPDPERTDTDGVVAAVGVPGSRCGRVVGLDPGRWWLDGTSVEHGANWRRWAAAVAAAGRRWGAPVLARIDLGAAGVSELTAPALAERVADLARVAGCAGAEVVAPPGEGPDGRALEVCDLLRNERGRLTALTARWDRDTANTAVGAGRVDLIGVVRTHVHLGHDQQFQLAPREG